MTTVTSPINDKDRYRPEPSVRTALKTPRILIREMLAGLVVALALIPEAISFLLSLVSTLRLGCSRRSLWR